MAIIAISSPSTFGTNLTETAQVFGIGSAEYTLASPEIGLSLLAIIVSVFGTLAPISRMDRLSKCALLAIIPVALGNIIFHGILVYLVSNQTSSKRKLASIVQGILIGFLTIESVILIAAFILFVVMIYLGFTSKRFDLGTRSANGMYDEANLAEDDSQLYQDAQRNSTVEKIQSRGSGGRMDESNQKNTNKHQIHNFRRLTILRKRKMQQRSQAEQSLTTQELPSFVAIRLVHFISAIVLVCAITAGIIQTHRYWIPVVKQIINPAQKANQNDCPVPAPKNSIHNDAASMRELDHRMFKQIKKENSDFSDKRETRLKEEGILLSAVDSAMQPVEDRDEEQLETLTAFIGDSTVNANELNATGLFEEELEESSKIHAVLPNTIIGTTDETAKEIKTFKSDDTSQYMESTKIENKEAPIVVKSQKELPSDEQDCESCEKLLEVPNNRNSSSDSNKVTETYIKSSSEIVTDSTIIKEDAVALPITDDPGLLIVEDNREIEPSSKDPSNIEEMPAKDNGDLRSEDKDLREYEPIISVENDKDASVISKRPPIESIKAENHTPTVLESTASRNIPVAQIANTSGNSI
ncbi:hypothetical protein ACOME3_001476 [Neoechinorhynchus agilis]